MSYAGFAVPALLSCLVNTIIKHFFLPKTWVHTHHVCCESLCLLWQNVGEVKSNKTNKQVFSTNSLLPVRHGGGRLAHSFGTTHLCLGICIFILLTKRTGLDVFLCSNDPVLSASNAASISAAEKLDSQRAQLSNFEQIIKQLGWCSINHAQCNVLGGHVTEAGKLWKTKKSWVVA